MRGKSPARRRRPDAAPESPAKPYSVLGEPERGGEEADKARADSYKLQLERDMREREAIRAEKDKAERDRVAKEDARLERERQELDAQYAREKQAQEMERKREAGPPASFNTFGQS